MTNTKLIIALVAVVVVAIGADFLLRPNVTQVAGSPVGSTFGTAKTAAITFSMLNSTSTSILNTDSSMRLVKGSDILCTGVGTSNAVYVGTPGIASLTMQIATSATALTSPASPVLSPYAEVGSITIATGTVDFINASSTPQTATSSKPIEWPSGTYMNFTTNATNTAVCTVGINYLGS